jgi:hypothetical protein
MAWRRGLAPPGILRLQSCSPTPPIRWFASPQKSPGRHGQATWLPSRADCPASTLQHGPSPGLMPVAGDLTRWCSVYPSTAASCGAPGGNGLARLLPLYTAACGAGSAKPLALQNSTRAPSSHRAPRRFSIYSSSRVRLPAVASTGAFHRFCFPSIRCPLPGHLGRAFASLSRHTSRVMEFSICRKLGLWWGVAPSRHQILVCRLGNLHHNLHARKQASCCFGKSAKQLDEL